MNRCLKVILRCEKFYACYLSKRIKSTMSSGLEHDNEVQIGEYVGEHSAKRPSGQTLVGRVVSCVPLNAQIHCPDLWQNICGTGRDRLWHYVWAGPFPNIEELQLFFTEQNKIGDFIFYAIVENKSNRAVGLCSYNTVIPKHRSIQVT